MAGTFLRNRNSFVLNISR